MKYMKYTYPAHFINEENGSISVFFPDLQGCFTGGWSSHEEALLMAEDVLEGHIELLFEENEAIPKPTKFSDVEIPVEIAGEKVKDSYTMLVVANVENMKNLNKPVKKTLSIPYWLNAAAEKEHINFSGVLQEALKERLG